MMNKGPRNPASLSSEIHCAWTSHFKVTNDLVVASGSIKVHRCHLRVMGTHDTHCTYPNTSRSLNTPYTFGVVVQKSPDFAE